jgi:hypothetical protein
MRTVYLISMPLRAIRPGELAIPGPTARFSWTSRFEEDFLDGRSPVDRRDAVVEGKPLTLTIAPLPEQGRPPEFAGAIGRFSVHADVTPARVGVGESFALTLTVEGEGNLDLIEIPRIAPPGFHVRGASDEGIVQLERGSRRTIRHDIAALSSDVVAVPPIPFAFFDPEAGSYRTIHTKALPIEVAPVSLAVAGDARVEEPRPDGPHIETLAFLAVAIAFAVWAALRRRRKTDGDGVPVSSATAIEDDAGVGPAGVLTRALAARLRCSTAAVIAPDLAQRLETADVPADLSARAASLLKRLVAARYGGAPVDDAQAQVDAIVSALSAAR